MICFCHGFPHSRLCFVLVLGGRVSSCVRVCVSLAIIVIASSEYCRIFRFIHPIYGCHAYGPIINRDTMIYDRKCHANEAILFCYYSIWQAAILMLNWPLAFSSPSSMHTYILLKEHSCIYIIIYLRIFIHMNIPKVV